VRRCALADHGYEAAREKASSCQGIAIRKYREFAAGVNDTGNGRFVEDGRREGKVSRSRSCIRDAVQASAEQVLQQTFEQPLRRGMLPEGYVSRKADGAKLAVLFGVGAG